MREGKAGRTLSPTVPASVSTVRLLFRSYTTAGTRLSSWLGLKLFATRARGSISTATRLFQHGHGTSSCLYRNAVRRQHYPRSENQSGRQSGPVVLLAAQATRPARKYPGFNPGGENKTLQQFHVQG